MHLLLYAGICAHTWSVFSQTKKRTPYIRSRTRARRIEQNTSRPHFQFVSVSLKNGERDSRSARSWFFQPVLQICASGGKKKKIILRANGKPGFLPFSYSISEFVVKGGKRISLPKYIYTIIYSCINSQNIIIIFQAQRRDPHRLCIFILLLK